MQPDDERLAQIVRLIRRELSWTQQQLAVAASVPLNDVKAIEAGNAARVDLGRIRRVLESEGGRIRLVPWWNGAAMDRLLDHRHAELVERCVAAFRARHWQPEVEFSFSEFGERGSIDVLGLNESCRAAAVCEVKSDFGSLEETNRVLDAKERLAPKLVLQRYGWKPAVVARILIVPRTSAVRRVMTEQAATMAAIYPARTLEIRAWLRQPVGSIRGIWFVSDGPNTSTIP